MEKKKFDVLVNITVATTISDVEAENEEQAETIARNWIGDDYMHYVREAEMYVDSEVVETTETSEDDDTTLGKAIRYVREQMDEDDMAILHAEMNKCYKMHLIPNSDVMDCSKVIDLLEEYGQDNDLPEGWWESECEMDDILVKL